MEYFSSRVPIIVYKMPDGSKVETEVMSAPASAERPLHTTLYLWTQYMQDDDGDLLVGFDVEWTLVREGDKINPRASLLKLGSRYGCLVIKLDFRSRSMDGDLRHFLLMKNITFVGVHIKEDLVKLKSDYGIVIRNAVDLSDLAPNVLRQPRLAAYSLKGLANEVLSIRIEHRPLDLLWVQNWGQKSLTEKQIEFAATEAHLIFRIAEKLWANTTAN